LSTLLLGVLVIKFKLEKIPYFRFKTQSSFILATPADVSMLMQLGVDGCFVGSGIFKSNNPQKRAVAMVQAVTHYKDPAVLSKISENLGEPMVEIFELVSIFLTLIEFSHRLALTVMKSTKNGKDVRAICQLQTQRNNLC